MQVQKLIVNTDFVVCTCLQPKHITPATNVKLPNQSTQLHYHCPVSTKPIVLNVDVCGYKLMQKQPLLYPQLYPQRQLKQLHTDIQRQLHHAAATTPPYSNSPTSQQCLTTSQQCLTTNEHPPASLSFSSLPCLPPVTMYTPQATAYTQLQGRSKMQPCVLQAMKQSIPAYLSEINSSTASQVSSPLSSRPSTLHCLLRKPHTNSQAHCDTPHTPQTKQMHTHPAAFQTASLYDCQNSSLPRQKETERERERKRARPH